MRPLLLLAALVPLAASAQDLPIRWGEVSDAEWSWSEVPNDPDAAAIVLGDVGVDEVVDDPRGLRYRRRRHFRVKVLSEAGYRQGEIALRYPSVDQLHRVRGHTFVPEPSGQIRRVELAGASVFRERVRDGVDEVRFTMPALAPGAIFEVEYTWETDDVVTPPAWTFQSDEPTVVSEYRVEIPGYLDHATVQQDGAVGQRIESDVARAGRSTRARWTGRGLPAVRDEPYTTTEADYQARVQLQLRRYVLPGQPPRDVLRTWPEVAQTLERHEAFGQRLRSSRLRRAQVEGVAGTADERARAVYDQVRTGYVSNGRRGVFAGRDLNDVVEARSGSDPELTLLLAALLREADVPAQLVLISTRGNGRPNELYPIVDQFDRLAVAVADDGGRITLLDPTDPARPYGVLPVESLNQRAWLADPVGPRWIDVAPPSDTGTATLVDGVLGRDGQLTGSVQLQLSGYDAQRVRDEMADEPAAGPAQAASGAAVLRAADASGDVRIAAVEVDGLADPGAPLAVTASFVAPAAESVGDELYLSPFVLMKLDENPFQSATRTFPVDFAYPFTRTYVASITLPEGYVAEEVPAPTRRTIPGQAVTYTRMIAVEGDKLMVRTVLTVNKARVEVEEYPALRGLYAEVVAAEAEAVVLVRAGAVAESEGPAVDDEAAADSAPDGGDGR